MTNIFEEENTTLSAKQIMEQIKAESLVISGKYTFKIRNEGSVIESIQIGNIKQPNLSTSFKTKNFRRVESASRSKYVPFSLSIIMDNNDRISLQQNGIIVTCTNIQQSYLP